MRTVGRYDNELNMYVEEVREPDMNKLMFLRWLADHWRIEHLIAGPPCGEFAPNSGGKTTESPVAYSGRSS